MPGRAGFHKCHRCKRQKPNSEFRTFLGKNGQTIYNPWCKTCEIERKAEHLARYANARKNKIKKLTSKEFKRYENQQELQRLICKGFGE